MGCGCTEGGAAGRRLYRRPGVVLAFICGVVLGFLAAVAGWLWAIGVGEYEYAIVKRVSSVPDAGAGPRWTAVHAWRQWPTERQEAVFVIRNDAGDGLEENVRSGEPAIPWGDFVIRELVWTSSSEVVISVSRARSGSMTIPRRIEFANGVTVTCRQD